MNGKTEFQGFKYFFFLNPFFSHVNNAILLRGLFEKFDPKRQFFIENLI